MKLTPLDIHHKEFRHSIRGYSEDEVDQFLDDVADEFERLFKENVDQSEKLEALQERVNEFELQRQTINNTLVAAQRSAEDIVSRARTEGDTILRDAEVKAKEIIHNALSRKQTVQGELVRIKQAEEEFRTKLKQMLDSYQRRIAEIELPPDVEVLTGETEEGIVGAVEVRTEQAQAANAAFAEEAFAGLDLSEAESQPAATTAASAWEPPAQPEPMAEEEPAQSAPMETPMPPFDFAATMESDLEPDLEPGPPAGPDASFEMPATTDDPPPSGFVQSVTLGEVGEPDLGPEIPSLEEPSEYTMPSLDRLGEREADVDIEEID